MSSPYIGVSFHPRDKLYEPRVKYAGRHIWLRTWHNPVTAARVRDVAAKWMYGPNARLNFPEVLVPTPLTESDIAGFLLDGGVPLKVLVHRIPLPILREAGVQPASMLQAGVSMDTLLKTF